MISKRFSFILIALLALTMVLSACGADPEQVEVLVTRIVTEIQEREIEIPVEVTRIITETETETVIEEVIVEVPAEVAALGSAERPIKVLFVPSTDVEAIVTGADVLSAALSEATGLNYEASVLTSYPAVIEEMCASPDDTIGFIPAQAYVIANQRCGITAGAAAVRRGLSWYTSQFVVAADSDIQTIEDLAGKTWAIPEFGSSSGYLYPLSVLKDAGIETGEVVEAGGHPQAMLAVYNGEVDFGTAFFSPPTLPYNDRRWTFGVDDPEIWRDAGEPAVATEDGILVAGGPDEGGYQVLDARLIVVETAPDIFEKTRIIALSNQIPNDSISFGPDFPLNFAEQIKIALVEFAATEACLESICAENQYGWTGLEAVSDSFYDATRTLMEQLGITEEDVLGG